MLPSRRRAAVVALALAAVALAPACGSVVEPYATGFEEPEVGARTPAGWKAQDADATWTVERDESARGDPQVVVGRSAASALNGHVCLFDGDYGRDVAVAATLKPLGGEDQGAGLVYRYRGPGDFDYVRWDARAKNLRAYHVRGGRREWIGDASLALDAGWRRMEALVVGRRLSVSVDGRLALTAVDDDVLEGGRAGLWLSAGASAAFDDFEVRSSEGVR